MDFLRSAALLAIRGYQRFISPHKGFVCAYRVHTGRCGCSQLGYRAIRRFGLGKGWWVLRQRTALCGVVHRRHTPVRPRPPARERGDCDLPCDLPGDAPCDLDLSGGRGRIGLCDACSCCDAGSCDWPSRQDRADRKDRRRNGRQEERQVYIPPYADLGRGTREPRTGDRR